LTFVFFFIFQMIPKPRLKYVFS